MRAGDTGSIRCADPGNRRVGAVAGGAGLLPPKNVPERLRDLNFLRPTGSDERTSKVARSLLKQLTETLTGSACDQFRSASVAALLATRRS